MARRVRRRTGGTRTASGAATRTPARARNRDNEGIIPILARAVREVEGAAERGRLKPSARVKFQAVALLAREARSAVKSDTSTTEARRASELKRLDGIGTILAKTAARDTSLLSLLAEDAAVTDAVRDLKQDMLRAAGVEVPATEDAAPVAEASSAPTTPERRVVPQSVISRQLANPFLTPQFSTQPKKVSPRVLAGWELLGPLFKSFEHPGQRSSMALPDPTVMHTAGGRDLMPHQAQVVAAAQKGHRTFLLADEPGLGKTAEALLAAQAADAYPLLCVVPSVVKTNWAREVGLWTPKRRATVVHGDGENVDAFADIVIVNYEVLDRHIGWFGDFGFRGMVVDEAHFIKNKSSQRSQHVLQLSERVRRRAPDALLMALTGTPLINDIEDFRAIWQFLGWIDDKAPRGELMERLEDAGLTPLDPGFYPVARTCVIDMGIVRRRKVDVATDIPARRIADIPVALDGEAGQSIRAAERELVRRLVSRYDRAVAKRTAENGGVVGIDRELVHRIASAERKATSDSKTGDNVFSMMRRIGQAKAAPAADYSAQLARSVGKVVFFAKHIDVMDAAEEIFEKRGLGYVSIRGDQTRTARQQAIDSFTSDPDVAVAVCSLTAAGVGVNLQVASNVVLSELSWTDAEQTQAIDRVHRIGQDMPVTAWRIIAAQTLDTKIAELIDSKAGLAARALEGSDEDLPDSADIQLEALVSLLTGALEERLEPAGTFGIELGT